MPIRSLAHLAFLSIIFISVALAPARGEDRLVNPIVKELVPDKDWHILTFDDVPPGIHDDLLQFDGATLGERLRGQKIVGEGDAFGGRHDVLFRKNAPEVPLEVLPGPARKNLEIFRDADYGSQVLLPISFYSADYEYGRGEGTLALIFDELQCAFGFRVWLDGGGTALWQTRMSGNVHIKFYDENGQMIGRILENHDRSDFFSFYYGEVRVGEPSIKAVTIENADEQGIAVDDVAFSKTCPTGLS